MGAEPGTPLSGTLSDSLRSRCIPKWDTRSPHPCSAQSEHRDQILGRVGSPSRPPSAVWYCTARAPRAACTSQTLSSPVVAASPRPLRALYASTVPFVTSRPTFSSQPSAWSPSLPSSRGEAVATSLRAKRGNPAHLSQRVGRISYVGFHFGRFRNAAKRFRHMFYAMRFRCGQTSGQFRNLNLHLWTEHDGANYGKPHLSFGESRRMRE